MRQTISITAVFVLLSFVSIAEAAIRTVALSGQPAPDTAAGVNYSSFDPYYIVGGAVARGPVINDAGRTAFRANLTGSGVDAANNQGIWSEGSGSLQMVARTGSEAPGMPYGMNFARRSDVELFTPVLNDAGQTAFYGGLADGSIGIWSEGSGSLALVAHEGMQAAGTAEGVSHSFSLLRDYSFLPDLPKLNNAGQTSFLGNLTGSGINNLNDWGIWSQRNGGLELVARGGNPAPGMPEGVNYDSFFFHSGFNDAGQTAYFANLYGEGVDPSNDLGIWSEASGTPTLVARSGSPAPGTLAGVDFESLRGDGGANSEGRVVFYGSLTGESVDETNNDGLWSDASGTLELVARGGSPAPDTPSGVNFDWFLPALGLNDGGQIAFRATLVGTGVTSTNNLGIWSGDLSNLSLVARTGSPVPDTLSGVRFAGLEIPALNAQGQTAFRATLTGTSVTSANDRGIWATDESGVLRLIARKGSQLEVTTGDFRTISDLELVSIAAGSATGFNNLGQLVFWARFTNGTQGVFVSSLVAHLPGDFNDDAVVDAADYVVWRKGLGTVFTPDHYLTWRGNFGRTLFTGSGTASDSAPDDSLAAKHAVPEPAGILLVTIGLGVLIGKRWQRASIPIQAANLSWGRTALMLAVTAATALQLAPAYTALAATIDFDANAASPAVILFNPEATGEAHNAFVTGKVPRDVQGPVFWGTNINTLLGADAFYSRGYTGTNGVMVNIEDGHIWSGHETLTHVQQIPNHPSALNEFDRHATWVGSLMGGRRGGANPGAYQEGMAPNAQLYSGAIATQWNGQRRATNFSFPDAVMFDQYRRAFSTGVNATGRTADVINSSWGNSRYPNGSDTYAIGIDGLVNANPHTLFVAIAGNTGPGPDSVVSPAAGYNGLSVGALGPNPPYVRPEAFTSGGPNDYVDPVNGTKNDARQVVDIAAPGENLAAAYYGGETGGNGTTDNPSVSGPGPTGLPAGPLGGPDFYTRGGLGGTSSAAPTVAGGAALLYDAAYDVFADNADARDARVMKAVLMNSADKTVGWNNAQSVHSNGLGGVLTTQGLDNRVGTGRMNLTTAYDQFLTGTTDIAGITGGNLGLVDEIGWDFGQVVSGTTNDYYFNSPFDEGATLTATLTWFRDRRINDSNTVFDDSFDDLNLELWSVVDGAPTSLISESASLYNESEHFSFALPSAGDYALRVRWHKEVFDRVADADQELYGLAWWAGAGLAALTIPEPASATLLLMAIGVFTVMNRTLTRTMVLALVLAGAAAQGRATEYEFTWIDYPGATETRAWGINDSGDIVGEFQDDRGYHAFILSGGVYTPFDHPSAVTEGNRGTRAWDINSVGKIVGSYDVAGRSKAYLRDGSAYVDLSPWAASLDIRATEINDSDEVVGYFLNSSQRYRGFLYDGTSYTTFSDSTAIDTLPYGMNNAGVIVGSAWETSGYPHAFRRDANGFFTTFRVGGWHSEATGINESGQIVGNYGPDYDECYGYVLSGGIGSAPDRIHVPGATITEAIDINNLGQVVGFYTYGTFDSGPRYGYLATPIPDITGDYNRNGVVDSADYVVWRNTLGSTIDMRANGDNTGASAHVIDAADYGMWRAHFGETAGVAAASRAASGPPRLGGPTDDAIPEPWCVGILALGGVAIVLCWRRQRCAQLCSAVILSFAFVAPLAVAKPVDMTWWSLEGDLQNSTDELQLYFSLNDVVDSSELLYGRTYSHAGGINAVGDSISAGGFDPVLQLHDVSGGGESTIGINDDGFLPLPPDWSLDSLLTWPGIAPAGGAIDVDPLPTGSYRLDLSAYDPSKLDRTSAWAMDFGGPGPAVTVTGIATTGGATVRSLKLGSVPSTEARFHVSQPSEAIHQLVVGTTGVGKLIIDPGSSLSTPGVNVVGDHGTAVGYALVGEGGAALWEAGESLTLGRRDSANGELTVSSGSRVAANVVNLGAAGSAHGTATIENPASKLEALSVGVGGRIGSDGAVGVAGGTGTLTVRDGGELDVTNVLKIWPGGTLVLSDPSSKITTGQFVNSGGTFDWTAGTLHINRDWPRFDSSGSSFLGTSTLTVDAGMMLKVLYAEPHVTPGLDIGGNGSGSLTIQNGGVVESYHGGVGNRAFGAASAQGTVVVTGTGSRWTMYGTLFVGLETSGVGELSITDGGQVSAHETGIGAMWGYGTVSVDGTDSALTSTWVSVGGGYITDYWSSADGVGRLTVKNGATVHATRQLWINSADDTVELLGGQINAGSVTNRGTVTGSGTVSVSTQFTNAGNVAPGPTVGLLNVSGDFVHESAGTLSVGLGGISPLHYDRLNVVNGTAALEGTLAVSLLPGFIPKSGNSFQIVTTDEGLSGTFASEILPLLDGGLFFDVLYDTNAVTLAVVSSIPGDYNHDGVVDTADYVVWCDTLGQSGSGLAADGNGDLVVDNWDYGVWRSHFGQTAGVGAASRVASGPLRLGEPTDAAVPEPSSVLLAALCAFAFASYRKET
jgi:T5SS/PEP-CTERM-associated repeat protein